MRAGPGAAGARRWWVGPFLFLLIGLWGEPASALPFAYVTNDGDNTVSVIDTATNVVVATVSAGDGAYAFGIFIPQTFLLPVPTLSEGG